MKRQQLLFLIFFSAAVAVVFTLSFSSCKWNNESKSTLVLNDSTNSFTGPDACYSCHPNESGDWKKSDHFKAMMVANDSTVVGNFNNEILKADGVTSTFFKKDGKYFINTQGDDGINHDYEVKYTFGYYPLQQYLVEFPGGRMQVPRQSFNVKTKKWYHQYPDEQINYRDWQHWTHQSQNWNSMCAYCHSTGLKKGYDEINDSYNTTYAHLTVSCESCHGMGKNHITYINSAYKEGTKVKGSYLLDAKNTSNADEINTCAPCHSRRIEISEHPVFSHEVLDNFVVEMPTTENYFADGQFRNENYEFGSFLQSKMFHRGVKCSNCHNPHSGKIKFNGNQLCLQCHTTDYDNPQHHFHKAGSEGAQCINCHMPTRTYMGADVRRDHSMRIPRPDQSVKYNTPNACNNCHSNQNANWAEAQVVKWYGANRNYHYSDDLIPGSQLDANAVQHLKKLAGDTAVTNLIRATAINYLGDLSSSESIATIKKYLNDSSALVRQQSAVALGNLLGGNAANDLAPLLNDPVRGVRVSAARAMSGTNAVSIPPTVNDELKNFMHLQADYTTGSLMLADYYYQQGDVAKAEHYYKRTIKIDSMANLARFNLASLYNTSGNNTKATDILLDAYHTDPSNPRASYNLALIYAETGNKTEALRFFEKAYRLKLDNDQLYYNYGLYLQQQNDSKKAEQIFNEGLQKYPLSEQLNYGAAFFYLKTGNSKKAMNCINVLRRLNPSKPEYQQLFKLTG